MGNLEPKTNDSQYKSECIKNHNTFAEFATFDINESSPYSSNNTQSC